MSARCLLLTTIRAGGREDEIEKRRNAREYFYTGMMTEWNAAAAAASVCLVYIRLSFYG